MQLRSVAICGRAALFREAIASAMTSRGYHLACCVSELAEAVSLIERSGADVLLLDASLAVDESLARLRGELGLRVLLLTHAGDEDVAAAALEAGLADAAFDRAVALVTLERAVNGQVSSAPRSRRTVARTRGAESLLTARERDVIGLLLAGATTVGIGLSLGVSRSTVHSHVQSILRKLGAQSRIEAVSIYLGETTPQAG